MARINLLPWREERKELLQRQFIAISVAVLLLGGVVVFFTNQYYSAAVSHQQARNNYLQAQINILNSQVREIRQLQQKRRDLLDRMRVIQDLQGTRPVIVRVFDEMVRTLPDGVFYETVRRQGARISLEGVAESNQRVSTLMRRLDGSGWFAAPNLTAVRAVPTFGEQASRFNLAFNITAPDAEADAEE